MQPILNTELLFEVMAKKQAQKSAMMETQQAVMAVLLTVAQLKLAGLDLEVQPAMLIHVLNEKMDIIRMTLAILLLEYPDEEMDMRPLMKLVMMETLMIMMVDQVIEVLSTQDGFDLEVLPLLQIDAPSEMMVIIHIAL